MKILIHNIPNHTKRKDLLAFVKSAMRGPWFKGFSSKGEIKSCELISIRDRETGKNNYHGIVEVEPMSLAHEIIEELNGRELMGRPAMVRKWKDRNGLDDRRLYQVTGTQSGYERRNNTDRRRNVLIKNVSDSDTGDRALKNLVRVYNY